MRSIFGRIVDMAGSYKSAHVLGTSGWKGRKPRARFTGYHKQMPKADLKALTFRLQREARS